MKHITVSTLNYNCNRFYFNNSNVIFVTALSILHPQNPLMTLVREETGCRGTSLKQLE